MELRISKIHFNLKTMMGTVTVLCLLMTVPFMVLLWLWISAPVLIAAGILALLMLLQLPMFLLVKRANQQDPSASTQHSASSDGSNF